MSDNELSDKELLQQALEAFLHYDHDKRFALVNTISARLVEYDDDEPVAWMDHEGGIHHYKLYETYLPLYLRPQQKATLKSIEKEKIMSDKELPYRYKVAYGSRGSGKSSALLPAPPHPKIRLTDDEILDAANSADFKNMVTADDFIFVIARAIEDKILEKNA